MDWREREQGRRMRVREGASARVNERTKLLLPAAAAAAAGVTHKQLPSSIRVQQRICSEREREGEGAAGKRELLCCSRSSSIIGGGSAVGRSLQSVHHRVKSGDRAFLVRLACLDANDDDDDDHEGAE